MIVGKIVTESKLLVLGSRCCSTTKARAPRVIAGVVNDSLCSIVRLLSQRAVPSKDLVSTHEYFISLGYYQNVSIKRCFCPIESRNVMHIHAGHMKTTKYVFPLELQA